MFGVLEGKLDMGQWWELATTEVNVILGQIRRNVARRIEKWFSLLLSICETTPGAAQSLLGSPAQKKDIDKLAQVPQTGGRPVRPLWGCSIRHSRNGWENPACSASQREDHGMHYNCRYLFNYLKGDTGMNMADVSRIHSKRTSVIIKGYRKRKKKELSQWLGIGAGCHRDCGSLSSEIFKLDWRRPRATWSNFQGSPASSRTLDQMTLRGPSPSKFFFYCGSHMECQC